MANAEVIVGLDIGTTKVSVIIAEPTEEGRLNVVGVGSSPSTGLRKGIVINIEATLRSVEEAVEMAEQMAGHEVDSVFTGISGAHIEGINKDGVVAVKNRGKEITEYDVSRVLESARAVVLPPDREIIHAIPQQYIIDDQVEVKDPIDMIGVRLAAVVHVITGSMSAAQNQVKCINRAGFRVEALALSALASAEAVFSDDDRDMGALLIDLGGGTADLMMYRDGAPFYTNVLAVGGQQVTSDLSILLRIPFESAERLKRESGACHPSVIHESDESLVIMGIANRTPVEVTRSQICSYIQPRMTEIFELIKHKIEKEAQFKSWQTLGGGIVLTGGESQLQGACELAQEIFGVPARLGIPMGLGGLVPEYQKPEFATVVGLVKHAASSLDIVHEAVQPRDRKNKMDGVRKFFRNFFE